MKETQFNNTEIRKDLKNWHNRNNSEFALYISMLKKDDISNKKIFDIPLMEEFIDKFTEYALSTNQDNNSSKYKDEMKKIVRSSILSYIPSSIMVAINDPDNYSKQLNEKLSTSLEAQRELNAVASKEDLTEKELNGKIKNLSEKLYKVEKNFVKYLSKEANNNLNELKQTKKNINDFTRTIISNENDKKNLELTLRTLNSKIESLKGKEGIEFLQKDMTHIVQSTRKEINSLPNEKGQKEIKEVKLSIKHALKNWVLDKLESLDKFLGIGSAKIKIKKTAAKSIKGKISAVKKVQKATSHKNIPKNPNRMSISDF